MKKNDTINLQNEQRDSIDDIRTARAASDSLARRVVRSKKRQSRNRITAVLAVFVVLLTIMQLILPAIAMTKEAKTLQCPVSVHTHDDSCWQDVRDEAGNVIGRELICGRADYVVHEHTDDCYATIDGQKILVCELPEIKEHKHSAACYAEEEKLICEKVESDGHQHTEDCYTTEEILTCDKEEHVHTEECYADVVVGTETVLICGLEESEEHIHDAGCFEEREITERQLICGREEHQHGAECYEESRTLTCGLEEAEEHHHTEACYEKQKVLVCGQIELHTHTKACYAEGHENDAAYLICGKPELEEHKHDAGCFEKGSLEDSEIIEIAEEAEAKRLAKAESLVGMSAYESVPAGIVENERKAAEEVETIIVELSEEELVTGDGEDTTKSAEDADDGSENSSDEKTVFFMNENEAGDNESDSSEEIDQESVEETDVNDDSEGEAEESNAEKEDDVIESTSEETSSDDEEESEDEESEEETEAIEKLNPDEYSNTLTTENGSIAVTAVVSDTEPIPENAELVVTQLTPGMTDYDAYMSALNRGFDDDTFNSSNSLLYDVSVMSDGVEYEPVNGNVDVTIEFKENQLTEELGVNESRIHTVRIVHLPVEGEISPENIIPEYVDEAQVEISGEESVSFALDSLSVITVTDQCSDVTIKGALLGTDMKSLGDHKLYAYLISDTTGEAYGIKVDFTDKEFSGTISDVPASSYRLVLAYKNDGTEMQTGKWTKSNVYESMHVVIDDDTADGGYVFGYSAVLPTGSKTITKSDNTVSFNLKVSDISNNISLSTLMDRALKYGITADEIYYKVGSYTNYATKTLNVENGNSGGGTVYSHRADGIDVVPNVIADINYDNLKLSSNDKDSNYYVTEKDKDKVESKNTTDTIVRNKNEIEDRVEIMISNTLRQAEAIARMPGQIKIPSTRSIDVSPYGANETIVLDATAISGEQNGFTIYKRPGQTVIFNINGQNAAPPQNTRVILVDENGNQIDIDGNPSSKIYTAGDEMKDAPASEGNVWNKIIWNFPDATTVTATNNIGGIFLVPKGDFNADNKGGGWIVARGKVSVKNEWYGFPGDDEPFKKKRIIKTFVGVSEEEIDPNYVLKLWTHTNDSTVGTTNEQLITTFVLKDESDDSLVKDNTGLRDQTGYKKMETINGNVVVEWETPSISVGNEHQVTEENSTTKSGESVSLIEFTGPFSVWSETDKKYVWEQREFTYGSEDEFFGVFNVSSHNEDYRRYVYVTNNYHVDEVPHDLTLAKMVLNPDEMEIDENLEYEFSITLRDSEGTALAGSVNYKINDGGERSAALTAGTFTIKLKKDESIKILQLPYGTKYTITERNLPEKCTVAFSGNTINSTIGSGSMVSDRDVIATNTYSDGPGKGNLIVRKYVVDNTEDGDAAPDEFILTVKNSSGNYMDVNGNETTDPDQYKFRIVKDQMIVFANWPVDTYTITEEDASSEKESVDWKLTIGGDASAAGVVSIIKGESTNISLTNTYTESGLRVTKKWLASDGVTDISAAVERSLVRFKLYYAYDQYNKGEIGTYAINRNAEGQWIPVPIELPDDPKGWGKHCGYYFVELDENGHELEGSALIRYDYNGTNIGLNNRLAFGSEGLITIVNGAEEVKNEIEVVKKWVGPFTDTEKTAQVQLKGVKTAGGDTATLNLYNVSDWSAWSYNMGSSDYPGWKSLRTNIVEDKHGSRLHIGDRVKLFFTYYDNSVYGKVEGVSNLEISNDKSFIEFTIIDNVVNLQIHGGGALSAQVVSSQTDSQNSTETTVENIGDQITLDASNEWYYKWSGITGGYSSYYVEEVDPSDDVTVTYTYKGEAVPENGIKKGTIVVTNTKTVPETGSVQVTKTFSGIGSAKIPEDFKIVASWTEDDTNITKNLTVTGKQPDQVSREDRGLSYTWTISDLPIDTEVSFTESNYTITGYNVTTMPVADSSGAVTTTATAATMPGTASFINNYTEVVVPIELIKVDLDSKPIGTGAIFALYKAEDINADGTAKSNAAAIISGTTGEDGILDFGSLKLGEYKLIETEAPEGYWQN